MSQVTERQQALIRLLADGHYHSGEEIGHNLGVSRAAVWKQLQKLSDYGLEVLSQKGRGYRLISPLDLLGREWVCSTISDVIKKKIGLLDIPFSVDSTNNYLSKNNALLQENKAFICLAEFQSEGRGRRGRRWMSPLGCNLYASFLWQFEEGATALEGLSLAVGVVVARSLDKLGVPSVSLKWPNDILIKGKKLGGVLLEMTGDPAGRCQVIIGVGINVNMPERQVGIDQPWTTIDEVTSGITRNQLAVEIIDSIVALLSSYADKGFAAYMDEWQSLDAFSGQWVNVISGNKTTVGIASGVARNGALLLSVNGIEQQLYGGELSLRLSGKVSQ